MTSSFQLCTYSDGHEPRVGIVIDDRVHDATWAFPGAINEDRALSMLELLQDWPGALRAAGQYADSARSNGGARGLALSEVSLLPPVMVPGTVYCAGANYRDHIEEMARVSGQPLQPDPRTLGLAPWHFIKPSRSCVVGHGASVRRPAGSSKLDWEAELAVVIAKTARNVAVEDALDHVGGYTIAIDLSARDLSRRAQIDKGSPFYYDWMAHKGFEGSCPLGPWIVPAADVRDPQNLTITLRVNDVLMQDSSTTEMIYSVAEQIAHLSRGTTLHPGDVILTGTPAGVGAGRGVFLQDGDNVRVEIEGLGSLQTNIAPSYG